MILVPLCTEPCYPPTEISDENPSEFSGSRAEPATGNKGGIVRHCGSLGCWRCLWSLCSLPLAHYVLRLLVFQLGGVCLLLGISDILWALVPTALQGRCSSDPFKCNICCSGVGSSNLNAQNQRLGLLCTLD